ncbi:hypothetical protein L1887_58542 [Cichorium endivia]|nr:hypothetical protein L1887_58542 [Cichorium endivia]
MYTTRNLCAEKFKALRPGFGIFGKALIGIRRSVHHRYRIRVLISFDVWLRCCSRWLDGALFCSFDRSFCRLPVDLARRAVQRRSRLQDASSNLKLITWEQAVAKLSTEAIRSCPEERASRRIAFSKSLQRQMPEVIISARPGSVNHLQSIQASGQRIECRGFEKDKSMQQSDILVFYSR